MKGKNVRGPTKLKPTMLQRVRRHGDSLYICLPKAYCESRQIKEGLLMALHLGREVLHMMPVEEE